MSLVKANSTQIGQSTTASQNFTLTTDGAGAMKISRGNAGATTADIITINSSNTVNAGIFNSSSDITLKTNVKSVEDATNTVCQLDGIEFDWISSGIKSSGVSAQDLEKVLPWLVETDENGIKSVNYAGLSAYLINSIKELNSRIKELETK